MGVSFHLDQLRPGHEAQSVTCLATDVSLIADPEDPSLIQALSHTFVEIDHKIISVQASPLSLRCGPWARHIYPSLVLVQPRKTCPCLTERLLIGRKESNQTNNKIISKVILLPSAELFKKGCYQLQMKVQSNLDYLKCQGSQESFRIIGSLNNRNRKFSDIFRKAWCFHRTSFFCQSLQLQLFFPWSNRNVCHSIKENELLGGYALQV